LTGEEEGGFTGEEVGGFTGEKVGVFTGTGGGVVLVQHTHSIVVFLPAHSSAVYFVPAWASLKSAPQFCCSKNFELFNTSDDSNGKVE
jgi:hypothetical protein